jgi:hypothetical protein
VLARTLTASIHAPEPGSASSTASLELSSASSSLPPHILASAMIRASLPRSGSATPIWCGALRVRHGALEIVAAQRDLRGARVGRGSLSALRRRLEVAREHERVLLAGALEPARR